MSPEDDFDETLERLHESPVKHPDARIDIRTWPKRVEIYLNRHALDDLIAKLQTVAAMSLTTTATCITLEDQDGKTLLEISTDDRSATM